MKKPKPYKTPKSKTKTVSEPQAAYGKTMDKTIRFFSSFEEENEYVAKQNALLSYDQRMSNIEHLRKLVFSQYLLPNGSWAPVAKVFKIMKPYTNETGEQL